MRRTFLVVIAESELYERNDEWVAAVIGQLYPRAVRLFDNAFLLNTEEAVDEIAIRLDERLRVPRARDSTGDLFKLGVPRMQKKPTELPRLQNWIVTPLDDPHIRLSDGDVARVARRLLNER